MNTTCSKCGGTMQKGYTTAEGLMGVDRISKHVSRLQFLVSDEATSLDPIKAFQQGASGAHERRMYRMEGLRCSKCGFIELYGRGGKLADGRVPLAPPRR